MTISMIFDKINWNVIEYGMKWSFNSFAQNQQNNEKTTDAQEVVQFSFAINLECNMQNK